MIICLFCITPREGSGGLPSPEESDDGGSPWSPGETALERETELRFSISRFPGYWGFRILAEFIHAVVWLTIFGVVTHQRVVLTHKNSKRGLESLMDALLSFCAVQL